jgi:Ca2+-binding RTX toxin-like protein
LCLPACLLASVIFTMAALDPTGSRARSRPTCAGVSATQVSHRSRIVAKPHAVVVARGSRDNRITVAQGDHTRHIICGASGDDLIEGGTGKDILVGGPGRDQVYARRGADLIVGDSYRRAGEVIGRVGRDTLYGGRGNEVIVGDNLGSGDATGGKSDRLGGNLGSETIVGDSAVTGTGTATGGADDWVAAMQGDDLVIGDSFSPGGGAIGGGHDVLNHALDSVLMIGDSATLTGTASGGGNDALHGATGGDYHQRCVGCDNRLYGDSYALSNAGTDWGTGNDLLTAGLGDDTYLDGQGSHPAAGGRGKTLCAGNTDGRNVAVACAVYRHIQLVRKVPEPPPPLRQLERYGAWWPFRIASPRP